VLLLVAAVVPAGAGPLFGALIQGYRRRLTRFTLACPGAPGCHAYATVRRHGARRGLVAAARRLQHCGAADQRTPRAGPHRSSIME
jgi:putative component of membrane protein insertase Oxa1/YidC/SpoIIIJ protein YidD